MNTRQKAITRQQKAGPPVDGLPAYCYGPHPHMDDKIVVLFKGESSYEFYDGPWEGTRREAVLRLNKKLNVTPEQAQAMLTGSLFGWGVTGANPAHWKGKV